MRTYIQIDLFFHDGKLWQRISSVRILDGFQEEFEVFYKSK